MSRDRAALACSEGVALLYQESLQAAHAALLRDDGETLHDLRVAMRRLQVAVENYADKQQAQVRVLPVLKRLINNTNRNRDAEVMLAWLQGLWEGLDASARRGARLWRKGLQRSRRKGAPPAVLVARLARLVPDLVELPLRCDLVGLTLGQAAAQRLGWYLPQLQLPRDGVGDEHALHQLRLRAKRVRYLLIPFRDELQPCRAAESGVRELQEMLGYWHDSVICRQNLTRLLAAEAKGLSARMGRALAGGFSPVLAEVAPRFAGLLTLARLNYSREQQELAALRRSDMSALTSALQQAVAALQHTPAV